MDIRKLADMLKSKEQFTIDEGLRYVLITLINRVEQLEREVYKDGG